MGARWFPTPVMPVRVWPSLPLDKFVWRIIMKNLKLVTREYQKDKRDQIHQMLKFFNKTEYHWDNKDFEFKYSKKDDLTRFGAALTVDPESIIDTIHSNLINMCRERIRNMEADKVLISKGMIWMKNFPYENEDYDCLK